MQVADSATLFFGLPKLVASAHQDFSGLITSNQPARPGEIIHLYASGFGPVTPPVPDGASPPATHLSRTVNPVTCGALDASGNLIPFTLLFAGLAPGPDRSLSTGCATAGQPADWECSPGPVWSRFKQQQRHCGQCRPVGSR